jgi:hypothetical protein
LVLSLVSVLLADAVAVRAAFGFDTPESVVWGVFGGIFVVFLPAVLTHPKAEPHGRHVRVGFGVIVQTAHPFTTGLAVVSVALVVITWLWARAPSHISLFGAHAPPTVACIAVLSACFFAVSSMLVSSAIAIARDFPFL